MTRPEAHPFHDVATRDPRLVLTATDAGVVRLSDRDTGLWIMIGSEEGSIMDRWADAEGSPFLRLDAPTVAAGTDAILSAIDEARKTARPEKPGFVVRNSEAPLTAARDDAADPLHAAPKGENK